MQKSQPTTGLVSATRLYRKLHRWVAIPLFGFFFLMGATGLLLGWKKQTGLLPATQKGVSANAAQWVSLDRLQEIAHAYARAQKLSPAIDRIDVRPGKGIAKIVFADHFTELQLDCSTGQILAVSTRRSDFIEKLHDGSILDFVTQTNTDGFKLVYTTMLAGGLLLLSVSGFYLWYNPKRIRQRKTVQTASGLHSL